MSNHARKLEITIVAVVSICFVIWSAAFIYRSSFIAVDGKRYFCLFDDAMVSMRYAWNFSHGLGLVWNPGERIEGYTNLLMTLLMSFATLILDKSAAVLFIQISGAVFMLAIAYLSMKIADHLIQDESYQRQMLVRVLSFFCVLFYYPLAYFSLMGMETGLLTLLLIAGILLALNYTRDKNPVFLFLLAVCLGLAYLTRNDSIIFAILIWSYIFWETFKSKTGGKNLWQLFGAIGLCLLLVIAQVLFRYWYYNEFLPNTYILKLTGMPLLARISDGVIFIKPFVKEIAFILVLTSMDLIFGFRKRKLFLLSMVFSAIGYQVYVGGDPWQYWRIMSPTMPLVFVLFIIAVSTIVLAISGTQVFSIYVLDRNLIFPRKYINVVLVVSVTLIGLLSANVRFLPELSFWSKPYTAEFNQNNVNTAITLNQLTASDATVGVYWGGSIPYFTGRKAIDFLGKSDKHIAHLPPDVSGDISWNGMKSVPGHNKYDLNYSIKTLQPTYVQDFKWGAQNLNEWAKAGYVEVEYNGVRLYLLKDSLKDPIYIDPNDAEIHDKLGYVLVKLGQFNEAIVHFREAGSLDGQAWVWATHPDVKMRDANETIVLAEHAAELTAYRNIAVLNTLAAAYAAAGKYQRAVTTARSALDLASVAGDYRWADYLHKQLELYKKKRS